MAAQHCADFSWSIALPLLTDEADSTQAQHRHSTWPISNVLRGRPWPMSVQELVLGFLLKLLGERVWLSPGLYKREQCDSRASGNQLALTWGGRGI